MRYAAAIVLLAAFTGACDTPTESTGPRAIQSSPAPSSLPASLIDDPGIDRSRLQPQLFPGLDWSCRWIFNHSQIFCRTAPARNFEFSPTFQPDFPCPNGQPIYRQGGRSLVSRRYYNSDYKLVERQLSWYNQRLHYSLHPDGSGLTASTIGESLVETNDYTVPGSPVDGNAVTTLEGTDVEIHLDAPGHRLLARDKGKLRINPDGSFTIIFGRWDFFTDPDRAFRRVCSALRGPHDASPTDAAPTARQGGALTFHAWRPKAAP